MKALLITIFALSNIACATKPNKARIPAQDSPEVSYAEHKRYLESLDRIR